MSKKSREILGIFPRNFKMAIQNIPFIVEWDKFSAFSAKFTSSLSFILNMRRSVKLMQEKRFLEIIVGIPTVYVTSIFDLRKWKIRNWNKEMTP